jgi:hypothetical protein
MLYPCSPSLQSLPVPGIGFCQTITIDQHALDRLRRPVWPFTQGCKLTWTDRTSQDAVEQDAIGHQVK